MREPPHAQLVARIWLCKDPATENAPPGRRGASGVTTGRRDIYLYICVDPWEVGEPGLCRERRCGKQRGDCRRGAQPRSLFLCRFLFRILEQRTNVCATCV